MGRASGGSCLWKENKLHTHEAADEPRFKKAESGVLRYVSIGSAVCHRNDMKDENENNEE
ncbi:hypothetical protein SAMN05192534_110117 [Alteribacillus persepolensis]|uniref:Uncharacterized protein n=1 Tax=Alteribacillus persepolensis TaxID=568899 RepID=A0A1G8EY61_9BACI|nr:hypothetical protein [Alteribacillus persepolensis]SDH74802.1 hypothetical protein SAMN05192534_110117 [Alteribacillus persepolensis]